jgi:hypothetical protein
VADAAAVAAVRLALQAAGLLNDRHKTTETTTIQVVYRADAPGTLQRHAADTW